MDKKIKSKKKRAVSKAVRPDGIAAKIPATPERPEHYKAAACIYVEGLSILCPNEDKKAVDIAFVKAEHYPVEINVYRSGCGDPVFSHTCKIEEKTKIEIGKTQSKAMGNLYMDSKKYDEDFSWMPDLNGADWHPGSEIKIRENAKNYLSAKLVLKDASFYTHLKSEHAGLQDKKDGSPKKDIGRVGRVLGADIVCDAGDRGISLRIESSSGEIINEFFSKREGPFFISVVTRPITYVSHLHHIYHHIIKLPAGEPEYDFEYKEEEKEWYLCVPPPPRITTFACQSFGGGDGPLPEFP